MAANPQDLDLVLCNTGRMVKNLEVGGGGNKLIAIVRKSDSA